MEASILYSHSLCLLVLRRSWWKYRANFFPPCCQNTFPDHYRKNTPVKLILFQTMSINYFSRIESFLGCLYPAFALHNANVCIRTHELIDLAYRTSLCRGLWDSGALGWEAGSQCSPAGARTPSSAAAPG